MRGRVTRSVASYAFALMAATAPAAAQTFTFRPTVQPEVRADLAVARHVSAVAMAGLNVPLGYYVRAGVAGGVGVGSIGNSPSPALRVDLTARFLLDPFSQHAFGPYAGGGLTMRRDGGERTRAGLLLLVGAEGRRGSRWTPAWEAALGEGVRVAVVLRRTRTNGR